MKKLRVGVIGVGYLGQFHAEKYAASPDVELVGLVDADPARVSQIAEKLKTQPFADLADLLGKVDAVSIVVPTVQHHRVAKRFLELGTHVLLEKPVTVTLEEADELIGLAQRTGAVLQVGHIERFNPAVTTVRTMLASPRYMTAERAAPFTVRCTDVNVVLDLMIHDLDIVTDLAGAEPKEVSAAGASVITREIDMATARIVFYNGCIADITASRVSDEKKRVLRVFDGEGVFLSDYQAQKAVVSRRGDGPTLVASDITVERRDTLAEEIRAFVASVRSGTRPLVSGTEGRRALALALTITDTITKGVSGFVPFSERGVAEHNADSHG
jgi:predicted dehydrogenase